MQAISIEEALNLFDPQRPLLEELDIKAYYVARDDSPLAEMKTVLKTATDFPKLLFSGPPGCGKKTELVNLRESLKKDFHVIMFSIIQISSIYSVSLDEMLFHILKKIADLAKNEKLKIYDVKLKDYLSQHTVESTESESEILSNADKDLKAVFGEQKSTTDDKKGGDIFKLILSRPRSSTKKTIELINEAVWDLEEKTKKDVLVIVSDMDKISVARASLIFRKFVYYLTEINCFAVYTFPFELKHFINFLDLYQNFTGIYYLPNFCIHDRNGNPDEKGRAKLKEIVSKRLSQKLIYDDAFDLIIQLSGGVLHELINLVRQSCIVALMEKINYIDLEAVQTAEQRIRKTYNSVYSEKVRRFLLQVKKNKKMIPDEMFFRLIKQFSIIEYGLGDELWYDINPIVNPLIESLEAKEIEIIKGDDHGKDHN